MPYLVGDADPLGVDEGRKFVTISEHIGFDTPWTGLNVCPLKVESFGLGAPKKGGVHLV